MGDFNFITLKDILVALTGAISAIVVAYLGYKSTISKKTKHDISDSEITIENLKSFKQISQINSEVLECFARTSAERFLILLFEKEKNNNYVTAVYELHKYNETATNMVYGLVNKYVKLKLDSEYENMIREIREKGIKKYSTSSMPDGMLKKFYTYENVYHSNIYFLFEFTNGNVLFYSIAKHKDEPFTINEETALSLLTSKLTQIIFENSNE